VISSITVKEGGWMKGEMNRERHGHRHISAAITGQIGHAFMKERQPTSVSGCGCKYPEHLANERSLEKPL
jgi:hypothetical protein